MNVASAIAMTMIVSRPSFSRRSDTAPTRMSETRVKTAAAELKTALVETGKKRGRE